MQKDYWSGTFIVIFVDSDKVLHSILRKKDETAQAPENIANFVVL